MTTSNPLADLQPSSVWSHFATLCAIPRSSYHEAALREHLIVWARARGIDPAAVARLVNDGAIVPGGPFAPDPIVNVLQLNLALDRVKP